MIEPKCPLTSVAQKLYKHAHKLTNVHYNFLRLKIASCTGTHYKISNLLLNYLIVIFFFTKVAKFGIHTS